MFEFSFTASSLVDAGANDVSALRHVLHSGRPLVGKHKSSKLDTVNRVFPRLWSTTLSVLKCYLWVLEMYWLYKTFIRYKLKQVSLDIICPSIEERGGGKHPGGRDGRAVSLTLLRTLTDNEK